MRELRRWQDDFDGIIDLIDKKRRFLPDELLLTRAKLRIIHKADGEDCVPIAGSSLFMTDAEYMETSVCEVKVLVERREQEGGVEPAEVRAVATILATYLNPQIQVEAYFSV
jgi:hypothetical protein